MKKLSSKKSNRISTLFLLPIVAVVIALPVFLTILGETPTDSTNSQTETNLILNGGTGDNSDSSDSPDTFPIGITGTDINDNANALDLSGGNADGLDLPETSATGTDGTASDALTMHYQEDLANDWEQAFSLSDVPAYDGNLYTVINDNLPFFPKSQNAAESFERYAELDSLGRCGAACANVGQDLMPTEPRGEIGQVRPSGWHTVKYDGIDGNYLYNRCHLIAYQLSGENANERNLITGTRSFNVAGMLPFEEMVGDYVRETNHHVLYRVTPMFRENNLVADGVLMEAWSVEDNGAGICFNVFVYNVQPGIVIDYATGDSHVASDANVADDGHAASDANIADDGHSASAIAPPTAPPAPTESTAANYILNTNTLKFHYPDCNSVQEMSERNKLPYSGTREEVIAMGYVPCKRCNP